jgi:hypothetical protein
LTIAVAVAVDDGTDDGTYAVMQPTAVDVKAAPHPDRTLTALDTAPEAPPLDDRTR